MTGGIASGKSLVAQCFRELGAAVVDADAIAREVTAPGGAAYQGVVEAFGRGILHADGTIDRKALGARVFADASARLRLNALTHPPIRRRLAEETARLAATPGVEVIVLDIPLLLDTTDGRDLGLDGIVVADASDEVRVGRLAARDGLSPEEARRRMSAQVPLREKVARADWIIDNNGSPGRTREQVRAAWEAISRKRPRKAGS